MFSSTVTRPVAVLKPASWAVNSYVPTLDDRKAQRALRVRDRLVGRRCVPLPDGDGDTGKNGIGRVLHHADNGPRGSLSFRLRREQA